VSSTDLQRPEIESFFERADQIAGGAHPTISAARVGLALSNTDLPLPLHVEQTLREADVEVVNISASAKIDQITREINASGAQVTLFSSAQTGAGVEASAQVKASFLNAGDGTNENPVRALMDAYAIYTLKGALQSNRIAILGNLKFSAEAHSLAYVIGLFGARLSFVSPAALSMPYDLTDQVRLSAYEVEETNDLPTTLKKTDALYLANIDPLRVEKKIYDKLKSFYVLTPDAFAESKEGIVVLGEWDGAQNLLASTRPHVERAARAMLLTLVEAGS